MGRGTRARSLIAYAWAAPTTAVGLVAGAMTLATGGRAELNAGILEFHGGFSKFLLERPWVRASAMTLGHVVIGRDPECLERCRFHEQVHVQQVERWGPLFLPAYIAASAWAHLRGCHYYRDNWFERDARAKSDEFI